MKVENYMWLALAVCLPGLVVSYGKKQSGAQAGAETAAGAYKTMTVERSDKEFTRTYSAALTFRQTLLNAGMEVNNALTQVQTYEAKAEYYDKQVASLERAVKATTLLMEHGSATYLEVLTAQQSLLAARLTRLTNRYNEISSVITLYQALGGGAQ